MNRRAAKQSKTRKLAKPATKRSRVKTSTPAAPASGLPSGVIFMTLPPRTQLAPNILWPRVMNHKSSSPGIHLALRQIGDRYIYRQPEAINRHNQDGITLACIDAEIDAAQIRAMANTKLKYPLLGLNRATANDALVDGNGNLQVTIYRQQDADEICVRSGDADLANNILSHPEDLLNNPEIHEAVSRWLYASWHGRDPRVRRKAHELLQKARVAKRGNRPQFRFQDVQLRQAYDDLVCYGERLIKCRKALSKQETLKAHFPDCDLLEKLGYKVTDSQYLRAYGLPSPSRLAAKYILGKTGMKPSALHKRIDQVRS